MVVPAILRKLADDGDRPASLLPPCYEPSIQGDAAFGVAAIGVIACAGVGMGCVERAGGEDIEVAKVVDPITRR